MPVLVQSVGVGVVLLALADIFLTVLHPRSGKGLLSTRLNELVWRLFRSVALALPRGRDALLSHGAPTLLGLTVIMWATLLILGFALVMWPALGSSIQASQGARRPASIQPSTSAVTPSPRWEPGTSSRRPAFTHC